MEIKIIYTCLLGKTLFPVLIFPYPITHMMRTYDLMVDQRWLIGIYPQLITCIYGIGQSSGLKLECLNSLNSRISQNNSNTNVHVYMVTLLWLLTMYTVTIYIIRCLLTKRIGPFWWIILINIFFKIILQSGIFFPLIRNRICLVYKYM